MEPGQTEPAAAPADPPAKRPRTDEPARPAAPVVALADLSAEEKQARHIAPIRREFLKSVALGTEGEARGEGDGAAANDDAAEGGGGAGGGKKPKERGRNHHRPHEKMSGEGAPASDGAQGRQDANGNGRLCRAPLRGPTRNNYLIS